MRQISALRWVQRAAGLLAVGGLCAFAPVRAAADPVADFYKGKQFVIVVGHHLGTGFDLYSRVLARHMNRHIPGQPEMIVRNMSGASGILAANWLYNSAPRDGTTMAIFVYSVALEKLFGNPQARFDPAQMIWIGNMEKSVSLCGVSSRTGVKTIEDLRKKEVTFGGTGATGPLTTAANALRNLLGAKVKVIEGYKGSPDVKTAFLRDEVGGLCGLIYSHMKIGWQGELANGLYVPMLQTSGDPHPDLKGVQHVRDLARNDEERQLFTLVFTIGENGRNYAMPPGVPPERVKAIRAAFMATMADPAFLVEAKKLGLEISAMNGEELEASWRALAQIPAPIVARAKAALGPGK
jgi:tripartite-type tricarboxylate transporter receptor subunit TctC